MGNPFNFNIRSLLGGGSAAQQQAPQPPAPQPNQPLTNSDPLPDRRAPDSVLGGLKSLKNELPNPTPPANGEAMPPTSALRKNLSGGGIRQNLTPFAASSSVSPSRPAPQVDVAADKIRTPKPNAKTPLGVASQHPTNVNTALGKNARETASSAHLELRQDDAFDRKLETLFPLPAHATAQARQDRTQLIQDVRAAIPQNVRGEPPLAKARYLGHALAQASDGDVARARAALANLQGTPGNTQAQQDGFAARCAMARSHAAFGALRDVEQGPAINPRNGPGQGGVDARDHKIHDEADWQTWRAADALLAAWPRNTAANGAAPPAPPASLDELGHAANAMLPAAERLNLPNAPAANATVSEALAGQAQNAKAFLCARALVDDTHAQPPLALRAAYLAHRNGIAEADVGKIQGRMYSLVKHAQRNTTAPRTGSWLNRQTQRFKQAMTHDVKLGVKQAFGHEKNPIGALGLGTAGGVMDHPEEDFSTLHSIDAVVNHLNGNVASAAPTQNMQPNDPVLEQAVRAAALIQWKNSIGTKGWLHDDMKLGRFQRGQMARDVAQALHIDKETVRSNPTFQSLSKMRGAKKLNAQTLDEWATGAGMNMGAAVPGSGRTLRENLDRMKAIRQDPIETPQTPQGNVGALCNLIDTIPKTWSVQMSSGGVYGLDANISENLATALGLVGAPSASVAPDVRYLKGRHAVLEVGSTSHHGEVFIGTDTRKSAHLGASGFIGWSLAGGKVLASVAPSLVGGRDKSSPRGVVIRAPYSQTNHPNDDNAWRGKLGDAVRTIGGSGPGGTMPQNKDEMWNGMAHEYFADPDLSIGWVENKAHTDYASLSGTGGVRYVTSANVKVGAFVSGEVTGNRSVAHATDESGARTVNKSSNSLNFAANASAAVVASPPPVPVSGPGPFNSLSFSSVPVYGIGTTVLQSGKGSTLRLYEEHGEIVPERTYRDTEFTRVGDYLQYIDSRNDAWVTSMEGNQNELSTYQTRVKLNATRNNQYHGERQRMVPGAAREINAYRGALRMYEEGGREPTQSEQQEMLRIRGEIARVLEAPSSWTNHVLYSYESNQAQRTKGLSYVFAAQTVRSVTAQRELSALSARA
ncbi:hypothetical protein [Paraburkholderia sp. Ac-20347]|uniref:hypothetical protein n=1 Tax=Paraburkholderia sp. Ac-20347 TaxID=2703892 RepID=UPI00197EAFB1|nr:hypothetical protein [Paraburkholderia sp. Ac-20347]MBN3812762.1 hypothetical protein [Paraburkholderia sp. Ac-20347]